MGSDSIGARLIENVERVILGKTEAVEIVVAALLARGHVLIEDVPGVGKTMLARAVARSIQGELRRLQCTPDLLPSDVTGVSIYDSSQGSFRFRRGPVFTNILLADEINRATPRTQSALLEAMEEQQVSVEGHSFPLPEPFCLLATQNPIELAGTFPLPEAQLDRFLVQVSLGYPDDATETRILEEQRQAHPIWGLDPVADLDSLRAAQRATTEVFVHPSILSYIQALVASTRRHRHVAYGASPRGALALMRASQALATIRADDSAEVFVTPDHVKHLAQAVLAHRLVLEPRSRVQGIDAGSVIAESLRQVPVPVDLEG